MAGGISSVADYHRATRHSRGRISPHHLDLSNCPAPFKTYDYLNKVHFPGAKPLLKTDLCALFGKDPVNLPPQKLDLALICQILTLGCGVRDAHMGGGIHWFFRTFPSAGGLHPCHVYTRVEGCKGIETGLYYCNMIQEFLGLIQKLSAIPGQSGTISFIVTVQIFKTTWKYRERGFRYLLLDTGHLIESLFLALKAMGLFPMVQYDFDDKATSRILELDSDLEIPLAWIHGNQMPQGIDPEQTLKKQGPGARPDPDPAKVTIYPLIKRAWELTGKQLKPKPFPSPKRGLSNKTFPWKQDRFPMDYSAAVFSRRSSRGFTQAGLEQEKARELLRLSCSFFLQDQDSSPAMAGLNLGVCSQNINEMSDGLYLISRERTEFELEKTGRLAQALSRVCLDQSWIGRAAMNFLFMADFYGLEQDLGPRGYRHILMAAGRIGQRIYLASRALGLGCCAVGAIYDEEARELFDLSSNTALFYVIASGPVKKP